MYDDAERHLARVGVVGEHRLPRIEVVGRKGVSNLAELADAVEDLRNDVDADGPVGRSSPVIIRNVVDLPAPFGPSSPYT